MELAGKKVLFVFVNILRCTENLNVRWDKMKKGVGNGLITFNYSKKKIVRLWGTDYKARSVNETARQIRLCLSLCPHYGWMLVDSAGRCIWDGCLQ